MRQDNERHAYLFDLEGTLINTHDIYCKIILAALFHAKQKYQLKLKIPNVIGLRKIISDEPYEKVKINLVRAYPELILYEKEIMDFFKKTLFEELTYDRNLPIIHSIRLLDKLVSLNHKVAIVSDCPQDLIRVLLEKSNISYDKLPIITPESCDGKHKPDPALYLHAAERLGVDAADCVVFEDSVRGIQAGLAASMKVVALNNYYLKKNDLTKLPNVEFVDELNKSQYVPAAAKINNEFYQGRSKCTVETYNIDNLGEAEKLAISQETYLIYRNLFFGRSIDEWANLLQGKDSIENIIHLMRRDDGQLIGFFLIQGYKLNYNNEEILLFKLYMGVLKKYRNSGIIFKSYFKTCNYIFKKYKNEKIQIFENIAGPVAYASACKYFKYIRPSPMHNYGENEQGYLKYLLEKFNYKSVDANDISVVQSQSCVFFTEEELLSLQKSPNIFIKYFIKKTNLQIGVGFACLIDANPGFLQHLKFFTANIFIKNIIAKIYSRLLRFVKISA